MNNTKPYKILKCPIIESIVEIRYKSSFPSDAIFGIFYKTINELMPNSFDFNKLPILQIPEDIRSKDPNLKYVAYYTLIHKTLPITVNIGPHVITFSNKNNYQGWEKYSSFISTILNSIFRLGIVKKYERVGVRYINSFKFSILDKINCSFIMNGKEVLELPTSIKTEKKFDDIRSIIQINNNILQNDRNSKPISLIDIDCINLIVENPKSNNDLLEIINKCHKTEKDIFFSLLKDDFLNNLEPQY